MTETIKTRAEGTLELGWAVIASFWCPSPALFSVVVVEGCFACARAYLVAHAHQPIGAAVAASFPPIFH